MKFLGMSFPEIGSWPEFWTKNLDCPEIDLAETEISEN